MVESIKGLSNWCHKIAKWTTNFKDEGLWNKMNGWMVTQSLQWQLDLEADRQVTKRWTQDNLENGKEYVGLAETPYWNMMLDRQVLRTEVKHVGHRSFLPQEVVRHEVWIGGS
jgi:hypothetical protein